jgi:hypothetical protein
MREKSNYLIHISLILMMFPGFLVALECQATEPSKTIELPQGCKLVLDSKINQADSIIVAISTGICDYVKRIQKVIPADSVTINLTLSNENILPQFGMGGGSSKD